MTGLPADLTDVVVCPVQDVAWEELDGEVVVLRVGDAALFVLDPLAAAVWHLLDGRLTLDVVVVRLAEAFAADATVVRRDVRRLVDDLAGHRLLAVRATAG